MIRIFPASLNKLYEMIGFIRDQAAAIGFSDSQISQIELALEEALVNIISYGYPNRRGTIEIVCLNDLSVFTVILKDNGIPYNPLSTLKNTDLSIPVEAMELGGHGIRLILKIMDEVVYRREGNCNILTLIKNKN